MKLLIHSQTSTLQPKPEVAHHDWTESWPRLTWHGLSWTSTNSLVTSTETPMNTNHRKATFTCHCSGSAEASVVAHSVALALIEIAFSTLDCSIVPTCGAWGSATTAKRGPLKQSWAGIRLCTSNSVFLRVVVTNSPQLIKVRDLNGCHGNQTTF